MLVTAKGRCKATTIHAINDLSTSAEWGIGWDEAGIASASSGMQQNGVSVGMKLLRYRATWACRPIARAEERGFRDWVVNEPAGAPLRLSKIKRGIAATASAAAAGVVAAGVVVVGSPFGAVFFAPHLVLDQLSGAAAVALAAAVAAAVAAAANSSSSSSSSSGSSSCISSNTVMVCASPALIVVRRQYQPVLAVRYLGAGTGGTASSGNGSGNGDGTENGKNNNNNSNSNSGSGSFNCRRLFGCGPPDEDDFKGGLLKASEAGKKPPYPKEVCLCIILFVCCTFFGTYKNSARLMICGALVVLQRFALSSLPTLFTAPLEVIARRAG
ncbi:unnamed protein product [Gongylonema pulchrum]|uniref:Transmembrane protein n=1 Tax=Gongylonema pulchrum TaxID=637853 RepID=A0A183DZ94_9BILA|nr:unnamed protein product [Gongylonema pulchrum]